MIQKLLNTIMKYKINIKNKKGNHEVNYHGVTFPWSYQDHIVYNIIILNQLPIDSDLHWKVVKM